MNNCFSISFVMVCILPRKIITHLLLLFQIQPVKSLAFNAAKPSQSKQQYPNEWSSGTLPLYDINIYYLEATRILRHNQLSWLMFIPSVLFYFMHPSDPGSGLRSLALPSDNTLSLVPWIWFPWFQTHPPIFHINLAMCCP